MQNITLVYYIYGFIILDEQEVMSILVFLERYLCSSEHSVAYDISEFF